MQREKSRIMFKLNCIHYKCKWSLKQLPLVSPATVGYNLSKWELLVPLSVLLGKFL